MDNKNFDWNRLNDPEYIMEFFGSRNKDEYLKQTEDNTANFSTKVINENENEKDPI